MEQNKWELAYVYQTTTLQSSKDKSFTLFINLTVNLISFLSSPSPSPSFYSYPHPHCYPHLTLTLNLAAALILRSSSPSSHPGYQQG